MVASGEQTDYQTRFSALSATIIGGFGRNFGRREGVLEASVPMLTGQAV
jgi:hypothetical protein